jgi:hypothetical protein
MGCHAGLGGYLPCILVVVILSHFLSDFALGQPATLKYEDCFSSSGNISEKLNVSRVYAQILDGSSVLNLTVIGQSNVPIVGRSNDSSKLGEFLSILAACMAGTHLCCQRRYLRPRKPSPLIHG